MDIDEVLVNLKVLEHIQVNQKLISRGPYLNIEYESIVPEFIRRWRRQDNRNETIKKINLVINSALKLKEDNHEMTERLDGSLGRCVNGLRALKETYATCCQTTARFDVIIGKIQTSINKDGNNITDNLTDNLTDKIPIQDGKSTKIE
uniref:Uncharacterized protein n=1 Tax=viral metagenome TaxID=1070528 RepID=A0A6C0KYG6_9ZZZZ|tara:strand:+ start:1165 stop:1608 length:444 start_codon:yes stop_codon:yes gene_type:complete